MPSISSGTFRHEFTDRFPGDRSGILTPRQTPGMLYALTVPTPVAAPKRIGWSGPLAAELGIDPPDQKDIDILTGNALNPTMEPYAACYAGHQFGNWAGQLGDGRAITLGEWTAGNGQSWELQLKGGGPTAYSRRADGRAVLRSSVREFLCSEAMHYLGVPTTRALSLTATGDEVMRDMFYDGRPAMEPGAIVCRVAPSFLRFGNLELLAARQETDQLGRLVLFAIEQFYPECTASLDDEALLAWFGQVLERTAQMVVHWQRVGFVHGVMNTDNMSLLGLTIDFGPFSFLDPYELNFTPNTTDLPGRRYAFGRQPEIAYWNLSRLAGALSPLVQDHARLQAELDRFPEVFRARHRGMMCAKLGLPKAGDALLHQCLQLLDETAPDYTLFFKCLEQDDASRDMWDRIAAMREAYYESANSEDAPLAQFLTAYAAASETVDGTQRVATMRRHNPAFILRNYQLFQAYTDLEKGDPDLFDRLYEALQQPYGETLHPLSGKRPDWAERQAGCATLSCSS